MQASANTTTSVAEVMVSPSASNIGGSTSSASAATSNAMGKRFAMLIRTA